MSAASCHSHEVATLADRADPMTWSDAGNMATDGKATTFTHDGRNRLIKAQVGTTTAMHYGYNPDGLRIESVKNPSSISAAGMPVGGTRTRYVLSGSEEVADLDANKGRPNYIINSGMIIVIERSSGQFRARVIEGTLNPAESSSVAEALRTLQRGSRP